MTGKIIKHSKLWVQNSWYLLLLSLIPLLTDYLKNHYQIAVQDLIVPLIINLLLAIIVSLIFYRFVRGHRLAAQVASILTVLICTNNYESRISAVYPTIKAIFPFSLPADAESVVFSLLFFMFLLAISYWFGLLCERVVAKFKWSIKDICGAVVVAISITFILVFLPSLQFLSRAWTQFFYSPPKLTTTITNTSNKPDIYYIVLDRYASSTVLKDQFGFDNSEFTNFLKDSGYSINPDAHNNFPYTTMSIASTLNADYLSDAIDKYDGASAQTLAPYHRSIKNSSIISALKSIGYTYQLVGNWYDTSNDSPLANETYQNDGKLTLFNHINRLNTFSKNEFSQSIFWRLSKINISLGHFKLLDYATQADATQAPEQINALKRLAGSPAGGRFIFAHILVPHDPYYFNADGSLAVSSDSNNIGKPIKQKYLAQVEYINSQIRDVLTSINTNSAGKSIVVLQSDEGPYPMQFNHDNFIQDSIDSEVNNADMRAWSDADLAMKFGNLAAYHIPQARADQLSDAADSVNVFRLILNSYFKTNLPILPKCYYAYPNGRAKPFSYVNINQRLTGSAPDPSCPKT